MPDVSVKIEFHNGDVADFSFGTYFSFNPTAKYVFEKFAEPMLKMTLNPNLLNGLVNVEVSYKDGAAGVHVREKENFVIGELDEEAWLLALSGNSRKVDFEETYAAKLNREAYGFGRG